MKFAYQFATEPKTKQKARQSNDRSQRLPSDALVNYRAKCRPCSHKDAKERGGPDINPPEEYVSDRPGARGSNRIRLTDSNGGAGGKPEKQQQWNEDRRATDAG